MNSEGKRPLGDIPFKVHISDTASINLTVQIRVRADKFCFKVFNILAYFMRRIWSRTIYSEKLDSSCWLWCRRYSNPYPYTPQVPITLCYWSLRRFSWFWSNKVKIYLMLAICQFVAKPVNEFF